MAYIMTWNWLCELINDHKNIVMPFLVLKQTHYEVHANGFPFVIKDPQWL